MVSAQFMSENELAYMSVSWFVDSSATNEHSTPSGEKRMIVQPVIISLSLGHCDGVLICIPAKVSSPQSSIT